MNLWLSPHGIWCYWKVTTLLCGRCKEIEKSSYPRQALCLPQGDPVVGQVQTNIWCVVCRTARDRLAAVIGQGDGSGGYVACTTPTGPKS